MATPALIDLSNYSTLLIQSTQSRAGTPDGNVFFDKANGLVEFIRADELANISYPLGHPNYSDGLPEANPLTAQLGIKFEGFYAFENQERADDEDLRKYDRWTAGTFKFAGAYDFVNSRKPSTTPDRAILRGSGWRELALDGGVDRIFFGNKGLSNIEAASQPYQQLAIGGAPTDFAKPGQIDEAVQVYGSTGNVPSDTGAGDFDTRTYEAVSIRTFGYNYDRKETTVDLGITELGPYSTGFALNETPHLTSGAYALADVYGVGQIAPWTGMGLEELDTPVVIGGFNEADGTFTWVVNNTGNGNLDQIVAFLDALAQTDDDINDHATNTTNGKRVGTWYSYDATGRIVSKSGADSLGLYFYNVPVADQQRVVFTDDASGLKTYPFSVSLEAEIGAVAKADANAWYHCWYAAAYNTDPCEVVLDTLSAEIKGLASSADGANKIIKAYDYDGETGGGGAGIEKNCVFLCEGNGGATQAKTLFTISRITTVAFSCVPAAETNA